MLLVCSLFDVPVGVCAYVLRDRHRSFVSFCEQDLDPHVGIGALRKGCLWGLQSSRSFSFSRPSRLLRSPAAIIIHSGSAMADCVSGSC